MAPPTNSTISSKLEEIRFRGERGIVGLMRARDTGLVRPPYDHLLPPEILWKRRRDLLASGMKITEALAPEIHAQIEQSRRILGVELPVEAYQFASSSPEVVNASFWGHGASVVLSFDGQLLGRFDQAGLLFFLGHELGHHLAHGAPPSWLDQIEKIYHPLFSPTELNQLLSRAHELTADRFGLLTCRDLDAVLRANVVLSTNLPASVQWQPRAYLDQCRAYIEALRNKQEPTRGITHPEHSFRAYAVWLFSESDLYRELTGLGSGRLRMEVIDRDLTTLLGLPSSLSLPVPPPAPPVTQAPASPPPAPARPPRPPPRTAPSVSARPLPSPSTPARRDPEPLLPTGPAPQAPTPEVREINPLSGLLERSQDSLFRAARSAINRASSSRTAQEQPAEVPDPLLDEERELLARFEALERKDRAQRR